MADASGVGEGGEPVFPPHPAPVRAASSEGRTAIDATAATATEPKSVGEAAARQLARPSVNHRIDKSVLTFPELNRVRDKGHLRFVAAQPCLLCRAAPSDPHHVRFAQPRAMARKVGDDLTVPLCRKHHRDLHDSGNEAAWWHDMGIEPIEIARRLWDESVNQRQLFGNARTDELTSQDDVESPTTQTQK